MITIQIQSDGLNEVQADDKCYRENHRGNEANLKAENLTSDHKEGLSEVKLIEINAKTLRKEAKSKDSNSMNYLPMLGEEGFFVKGWSHIIAGYPKVGKTELILRSVSEWHRERILYFTEESKSLWKARLENLPECYGLDHVVLCFAFGVDPSEILKRMKDGNESVVVIDTVRNLLGIRDESDNSEISRAMIPYVATARKREKTLIFGHHERKAGGNYGAGITGGHAFLGIVDIGTELTRTKTGNCRRLRGWGRIIDVPEVLYEKLDDGRMKVMGSPDAVSFKKVKESVLRVLDHEWTKTKEVKAKILDPKPSDDQLIKVLEELAKERKVKRAPPISKGKRKGVTYRWRTAIKT